MLRGIFNDYSSAESLRNNVIEKKQPVPIFIASTFSPCFSDAPQGERYELSNVTLSVRLKELMPMSKHLIEISPFQWGSDRYKFSKEFPFKLSSAVDWTALSSAVVDAPSLRECRALRITGLSQGEYVPSPSGDDQEIYLADGGFTDNLAVRNLIERGCENIIVIDAEHDPAFTFEGYQRVRKDLAESPNNKLKLIIKPIDQWLRTQDAKKCQDPDNNECFYSDNSENPIVKNPVMTGCISSSNNCRAKDKTLSYVKLSIDPDKISNDELKEYYKSINVKCSDPSIVRGKDKSCSFPHTPTFKLDYSSSEFKAHRLLGEELINANIDLIRRNIMRSQE